MKMWLKNYLFLGLLLISQTTLTIAESINSSFGVDNGGEYKVGEIIFIGNTFFSIKLNVLGYLLAIVIAIPIGFLLGLVPLYHWTVMEG